MEKNLTVDADMRRLQEIAERETPTPVRIKNGKGLLKGTCYAACPACGFQVDPSWSYCPKCGQAISW